MGKGLTDVVFLWVTGDDWRVAERSGFELPPAREALTTG